MDHFTSDPHFYHANVIKYCNRPFQTVEEMNEVIVYNWNSVVKPEDTVYSLGDVSFARRPIELYSHRLNGKKILIPGNHDPIHPHNRHYKKAAKRGELAELEAFYADHGWEVSVLKTFIDLCGQKVQLCHIPWDNLDPRYQRFKADEWDGWTLCGHVHNAWKFNLKTINVGVDVWDYKPVSAETIGSVIANNPSGFPIQKPDKVGD